MNNAMHKNQALFTGLALMLSLSIPALAQQATQGTANERAGQTTGATAKGANTTARRTTPQPAGVSTNNGNAGNSTLPTSTYGSTSDGSASKPSTGGAPGTKTRETRKPQPKATTASASGSQQSPGSASQPNEAARPGTVGDTRTTRSQQGAKDNSATTAGLTGARTNNAQNGAQNPPKMSPTATNGSSRNAQNSQGSSVSTSGKTGSRRPATTGQVEKEAKTSDEMTSTGYPSPTGVGKPGTPAGDAKGKKGNTKAQTYPQPTKQ